MTKEMNRIMIIGAPGAGKSTLATKLAAKLSLPLVHLDANYHQPGWTPMDEDKWREKVAKLVAEDTWVMDGNFSGTFPIRMPRADMIVWLDLPTWACLFRIFKRIRMYRGQVRPDMAPGCEERFDWEFTLWVLNFRRTHFEKTKTALASHGAGAKHILLRSPREIDTFLQDPLPTLPLKEGGL